MSYLFFICTCVYQCSGLGNKISGQRTDMFLKVSVPGLKMSVPKRRNIGKFAEMVSQGTDWWQIISVLLKNYQSGAENWSQSWSLVYISKYSSFMRNSSWLCYKKAKYYQDRKCLWKTKHKKIFSITTNIHIWYSIPSYPTKYFCWKVKKQKQC